MSQASGGFKLLVRIGSNISNVSETVEAGHWPDKGCVPTTTYNPAARVLTDVIAGPLP